MEGVDFSTWKEQSFSWHSGGLEWIGSWKEKAGTADDDGWCVGKVSSPWWDLTNWTDDNGVVWTKTSECVRPTSRRQSDCATDVRRTMNISKNMAVATVVQLQGFCFLTVLEMMPSFAITKSTNLSNVELRKVGNVDQSY